MYIVFASLNNIEHKFRIAAVSRNAAACAIRAQLPGCTIVSVQ
jgi:hypothetical protein